MRGVHIFEKPCYREIRVMRGRAMRGLPVLWIKSIPLPLPIVMQIQKKSNFEKSYSVNSEIQAYPGFVAPQYKSNEMGFF